MLVSGVGARIYDANGMCLGWTDTTNPTLPLGGTCISGLASGDVTMYVEGTAVNPNLCIQCGCYDPSDNLPATAEVHMAVVDIEAVDASGSRLSMIEPAIGDALPGDGDAPTDVCQECEPVAFRAEFPGLAGWQIESAMVASDGGQYAETLVEGAAGAESSQPALAVEPGGVAPVPGTQAIALGPTETSLTIAFATAADQQSARIPVHAIGYSAASTFMGADPIKVRGVTYTPESSLGFMKFAASGLTDTANLGQPNKDFHFLQFVRTTFVACDAAGNPINLTGAQSAVNFPFASGTQTTSAWYLDGGGGNQPYYDLNDLSYRPTPGLDQRPYDGVTVWDAPGWPEDKTSQGVTEDLCMDCVWKAVKASHPEAAKIVVKRTFCTYLVYTGWQTMPVDICWSCSWSVWRTMTAGGAQDGASGYACVAKTTPGGQFIDLAAVGMADAVRAAGSTQLLPPE
jgi:hypothetical protein